MDTKIVDNQRKYKGRVTVFSITGCKHCKLAKEKMKYFEIPYTEINLDLHPQYREYMFKKTNQLTVPQIFFNSKHLGGNDDFQKLIENGKLKDFLEELENNEPDEDTPEEPDDTTDMTYESLQVVCEQDKLYPLVQEIRSTLSIKTRTHFLKRYENCFVGKGLVDWLLKYKKDLVKTREEAVELGQEILKKNFFHHVHYDHGFKDEHLFYRFIEDETTSALNASSKTLECEMKSASLLAKEIRRLILNIYDQILSNGGRSVDYEKVSVTEAFKQYLLKTNELQRVDVTSLTREEKTAFFINIYNALVIHATIVLGPPKSAIQRYKFFTKTSYIIGGFVFTLSEIEHGILRGNKPPPGSFKAPFPDKDPRCKISLEKCEPLIHFALVCGAKSCPPINIYSSDGIDEQLVQAAKAFFEGETVVIDLKKKKVKLNCILKWYRTDFGQSDDDIINFIIGYSSESQTQALNELLQSKYKIEYLKYDWGTNKV